MQTTIHQADCLNIFPSFPDEYIDVVITSPPYNIGVNYNLYKDRLKKQDYLDFLGSIFEQIKRVLKEEGSFFLNIGSRPSALESEIEVIYLLTKYFFIQNRIFWIKSVSINEKDSYGHYKPINSNRFLNDCGELIIHATKNKNVDLDRKAIGVSYKDKSCVSRYGGGEDVRCRGNVWFIPYETVSEKKLHPATFPIKLPEWCLKLHGVDKIQRVLDPFMGTGTTLLAAKDLGIKEAIGIEKDKLYIEYAQKKLNS